MNGRAWRTERKEIGPQSVAILLICLAGIGAASAAVTILPLGDSITHGGTGDGGILYPTYRAWLYQDLTALGYDVDFVGSLHQPAAPPGSDPDNEGHAAYTSAQVLAELSMWLQAYPPPQVVLIHLGTNDVLEGVPTNVTIANLVSIIGVLRARNPTVTVLVAQIIPTSVGSTNTAIEGLNREIAGLSVLSTPQSPILVVDQYTGYDGDADNQEGGVHPVTSGEKKMAYRWEGALFPVLALGVPDPATTVPTTVITVPVTSPTVRAILPSTTTSTVTPRFGSRTYLVGRTPTRTPAGGTGMAASGTRTTRVSSTGQDSATAITPPATAFTRWYPETRWNAGLR
ncbi:MAG: SGNH/GDSL hydrolase family protein [Methanospirillum sp.]